MLFIRGRKRLLYGFIFLIFFFSDIAVFLNAWREKQKFSLHIIQLYSEYTYLLQNYASLKRIKAVKFTIPLVLKYAFTYRLHFKSYYNKVPKLIGNLIH